MADTLLTKAAYTSDQLAQLAAQSYASGNPQAYQQILSPYIGQQVQARQVAYDMPEGGSAQNFYEFLNPITGQWERSANQIQATNPYGGEGSAPEGWNFGLPTQYNAGSGGYRTSNDMWVTPQLNYKQNPDGTWTVDSGNYDVSQYTKGVTLGDAAIMGSILIGGALGGGAWGGGAEGAAGAGTDLVQANSINALDASTGVGYGSEGSLLTGPTSVSGDYNLLTGADISSSPNIGINLGAPSGTGLTMPTAPNLEAMGGGQGLTATGAQGIGDASSFINSPLYQAPGAGSQTVSAAGTFNPYVPSLGDPASFINGGTAGTAAAAPSLSLAPGDVLKGLQLGGQLAGLLGGSGSLGGGDQASYAGGGVGGTADSSNAGLAPSLGAQGGAAGSIEGVANTLLTAKDTFGYGKSMLG